MGECRVAYTMVVGRKFLTFVQRLFIIEVTKAKNNKEFSYSYEGSRCNWL